MICYWRGAHVVFTQLKINMNIFIFRLAKAGVFNPPGLSPLLGRGLFTTGPHEQWAGMHACSDLHERWARAYTYARAAQLVQVSVHSCAWVLARRSHKLSCACMHARTSLPLVWLFPSPLPTRPPNRKGWGLLSKAIAISVNGQYVLVVSH